MKDNKLLESYLQYLTEAPIPAGAAKAAVKKAPGFFKSAYGKLANPARNMKTYKQAKNIIKHPKWVLNKRYWKPVAKTYGKALWKDGVKSGFYWAAALAALSGAWKIANVMYYKGTAKCGVFKNGPGKNVCVERAKITLYQQRLSMLARADCTKFADQAFCKQKVAMEIANVQKKILACQSKIRENLGEGVDLSNHKLEPVNEIIPLILSFIGMAIADKAIFIAGRTVQGMFSNDARRCGVYGKGPDFKLCMSKAKLNYLNKALPIASNALSKCNQSRNPQKCTEKIQDNINKMKISQQEETDNITAYTNEINKKKAEELAKQQAKAAKKMAR